MDELQLVLSEHLYLNHLGQLVGLWRLELVQEEGLSSQQRAAPSFRTDEASSS